VIIGITLAIMLVISLISVIAGNSFIGILTENVIETEAIINGSTTIWETVVPDYTFGLDPITGGIVLIVTVATLGALIGIRIVGSGLSESSIKILMTSFFYGGIWTLLSVISANLIIAIEGFGALIYLVLTLLYAIGVVSKFFGGEE